MNKETTTAKARVLTKGDRLRLLRETQGLQRMLDDLFDSLIAYNDDERITDPCVFELASDISRDAGNLKTLAYFIIEDRNGRA